MYKIQYRILYNNGQTKTATFKYETDSEHTDGVDYHSDTLTSLAKMIKFGDAYILYGAEEGDILIILSQVSDITLQY